MTEQATLPSESKQKEHVVRRTMPRWLKGIFMGCAVLLVVGLIGEAISLLSGPTQKTASAPAGEKARPNLPGVDNLVGEGEGQNGSGSTSGQPSGESDALHEWSPALVKLGFSFFVGFAIGYALRTFFKVSMVVIGLNLLLLFFLSYTEIIQVRWDVIQMHFDRLVAGLQDQFTAFKAFIEGSLPSAGLFATGFYGGLRKGV